MILEITQFISTQAPPSPLFIEGVGTTENTIIMIALIGLLVVFHKVMTVPIVCMLGGMLVSIPAVLETHVYYFPYLNLLVILVAMYVVFDGFMQYSNKTKSNL